MSIKFLEGEAITLNAVVMAIHDDGYEIRIVGDTRLWKLAPITPENPHQLRKIVPGRGR